MTHASHKPAKPGDNEWKEKLATLRLRRRQMQQVARALGLNPDSPKGTVLCEFLLGEIFGEAVAKPQSRPAVLRELQAVLKAAPADSGSPKGKGRERPGLKQHLEQLYGPGVVVVEEGSDGEEEEKSR